MRWHTYGAGWCVACVWRVSDVIKTWVYEQELGDRYICQGEHSRTFGNHEGAWSKQLEWWNHMGTFKVNWFTSRSDLEMGWAGGLCLELFQTSWGESEVMQMICSRYETCLMWLYGYLAYWGMVAVDAWLVLEGLKVIIVLWSSRANKSDSKLFLGGKWLFKGMYWLNIKIPEGYWGWGVLWGWPNILWSEVNNYLPIELTVFRKTNSGPYISSGEITNIKELLNLVLSGRRSGVWRIFWAKISKFFCGKNWDEIFWGIHSLPNWNS